MLYSPATIVKGKIIAKKLSVGNVGDLSSQVLSEETLKQIAIGIKQHSPNTEELLTTLIKNIPDLGKNFDWNTGSILQHFDSELIVKCLERVGSDFNLYNSIGLCWAFQTVALRPVSRYIQ